MSQPSEQTDSPDRSATVAFRTPQQWKHLVQAAAARRGCLPSDWLRELLRKGLRQEFGQLSALDHGEGEGTP